MLVVLKNVDEISRDIPGLKKFPRFVQSFGAGGGDR